MAILNAMPGGGGVRIPLEAPTALVLHGMNGRVLISWKDPVNKYANPGGELVAEWAYTLVVRKVGSAPANRYDGELILKETIRDQYSTTTFEDSDVTNNVAYYYAIFACTTYGVASVPLTGQATPLDGLYHSILEDGLSVLRAGMASASNPVYAVFATGYSSGTSYKNTDGINASLVRVEASTGPGGPSYGAGIYEMAGVSIGNYALFGGGYYSDSSEATRITAAYNTSLTYIQPESLYIDHKAYGIATTTAGSYAFFLGGNRPDLGMGGTSGYNASVYTASLTRVNVNGGPGPYQGRGAMAATAGTYALVAIGYNNRTASAIVGAYNQSLTYMTDVPPLSSARTNGVGASLGGHAIFAGGGSTVEAYNSSLTKTALQNLSVGRNDLVSTVLDEYALFGTPGTAVDLYNSSGLAKMDVPQLTYSRSAASAATIGDYALFAGGGNTTAIEYYTK